MTEDARAQSCTISTVTHTTVRILVLLVCYRDYTKTTEKIFFTKFGWKIGLGPEKNPLTFVQIQENFKLQDRAFCRHFPIFSLGITH